MTRSPSVAPPVRLLDVNLLVALSWPHHVLFRPAQDWFAGVRTSGWATTPTTAAGLARLSMNPAVSGRAPAWSVVLELVQRLVAVEGHRRWHDDGDLVRDPVVRRARVIGHRQVTDVLLVAAAARAGGRLATVDRGVAEALHPQDRHLVEVVPAR